MSNGLPQILYVDDEDPNLVLFKIAFREELQVITANSGNSGLQMLEEFPDIECVISDMRMPGMTGLEFIKQAREDYPHLNYYLLTGFELSEEINDALNENIIKEYFRKPFDKELILETIS